MKLIQDLGMIYPTKNSKQKTRYGIYECPICRKSTRVAVYRVKNNTITKCKSCSSKKHGDYGSSLYNSYRAMIQRCKNKNDINYDYYGGRGIDICDEWISDYSNFKTWAESSGYSKGLTIDRIDLDGSYEPSNCRWANKKTQSRNTRKIRKCNTSGYRGVSKDKNSGKFRAYISTGKQNHLGRFDTAEEAARAYDKYIEENNLEHTKNFN